MVKDPLKHTDNITLPRDFYLQLRNWILDVEKELQSLRSAREMTVWDQDPYECNGTAAAAGGMERDHGAFPFRVMFKNSGPHLSDNTEELIVCGAHTTSEYEADSVIYAGPGRMITFSAMSLSVTGEGYVYLVLNLDADSEDYLTVELEFNRSAPFGSAAKYPVLLAQIGRSPCGFMTITQLHYGHIHIAGRIV